MIPPNAIIPFDGLHASIPDGWVRDTRFDDKFIKGASTGLGDTGGGLTHTHTSSAHSHTMTAHTHTMKLYAYSGPGQDDGDGSGGTDTGHSHWGGDPKTSTAMWGGTLSNTVNYPASSNIPAYYSFVFIKSLSFNQFPANGIILSQLSTRANAAFHANSANKSIRGSGLGADAGATGGADAHTHDLTHTHSAVNHSHTGETLVDYSSVPVNTASGNKHATSNHSHTLYWNDYSLTGASASLVSSSGDNIPLSKKINLFKVSAESLVNVGDIVLITETQNPIGWITCDGNNGTPNLVDFYIRNKSTASHGEETLGANTHIHSASVEHTHGTFSHVHTATTSFFNANGETGVGSRAASEGHAHGTHSSSANNASWASSSVSASSDNNHEPPYIKVKFIQATKQALGGTASIMGSFV